MKKFFFLVISVLLIIVTACGEGEGEHAETDMVDESAPIEVDLQVPNTAEEGETVTFSSKVTQGEGVVEDANEVVYEIWLEGQKEESELIEAQTQEGHVYSLDYIFDEKGLYHVQTHVTARGLHRMPTAQIIVGTINEAEHDHEHDHDHEPKHADVTITTETDHDHLVMQIEINGVPFTGGNVTLEVRENKEDIPLWLDLTESSEGEFQLERMSELDKGTYYITVHIEDEHLHEHKDLEIEL